MYILILPGFELVSQIINQETGKVGSQMPKAIQFHENQEPKTSFRKPKFEN